MSATWYCDRQSEGDRSRKGGTTVKGSSCAVLAFALALLALTICPPASAQLSTGDGGWTWLDPLPQGNRLETVTVLDPLHAVAAGDTGTMLTTSNGGASWPSHDLRIAGAHVADLSFPDADHGWAAVWVSAKNGGHDKAFIAQTSDGGATWAMQPFAWAPSALQFISPSRGWVCVGDSVWSTRNAGRTWATTKLRSNWTLSDIAFTDAAHGWAVGYRTIEYGLYWYPIIVSTTDGGATWKRESIPAGDHEQQTLNSVSFVDALHGWAVGSCDEMGGPSIILATADGGATWQTQPSGTTDELGSVTFVDTAHGWLTGGGKVYATTDGGATWTPYDAGVPAVAVSFADDQHGVAVGGGGGIATSVDGGTQWQVRSSVSPTAGIPPLADITFADALHGWAVGSGAILATTDGGATWASQAPSADLKAVSFPDVMHGWAVGAEGLADQSPVILNTTDGGLDWQTQHTGTSLGGGFRGYTGIQFLDADHGWVTGSSGAFPLRAAHPTIGRTTDGGSHWRFVQLRRVHNVATAVSFVDARHGWVVCAPYNGDLAGSRVLRTIDGGLTWRGQYTTGTRVTLRAVTFVDRLHGWAVGGTSAGRCVVLSTTNGGRTWSRRDLSSQDPYGGLKVAFTDARHGWIANGSTVLATTDGGRHWVTQRPGTFVDALTFIDPAHGWAVAETADWTSYGGGILTTATGGRAP
jgi:photosystem II stability/assembly factor-like uncharacterized protein